MILEKRVKYAPAGLFAFVGILWIGVWSVLFILPITHPPLKTYFIVNAVPVAAFALAVKVFPKKYRSNRKKLINACCILCGIFYLFSIVAFTILDTDNARRFCFNGIPFWTIYTMFSSAAGGFLPLGYVVQYLVSEIFLLWPICFSISVVCHSIYSRQKQAAFIFAVPIVLELTQAVFRRGTADIDDVILNCIGLGLYYALTALVRKRKH